MFSQSKKIISSTNQNVKVLFLLLFFFPPTMLSHTWSHYMHSSTQYICSCMLKMNTYTRTMENRVTNVPNNETKNKMKNKEEEKYMKINSTESREYKIYEFLPLSFHFYRLLLLQNNNVLRNILCYWAMCILYL